MTPYLGFWYFWGVILGVFGFVFEFFLECTQKVRQGIFSSFWSYEPPFRQEGGEGEAVTNGRTNEWTDGKSTPRLRQLRWAE